MTSHSPWTASRRRSVVISLVATLVLCATACAGRAADERTRLERLVDGAADHLRRTGTSRTTVSYSLGATTAGRLVVAGASADLETLEDYGVALDVIELFRASREPMVALSLRDIDGRRQLLHWEPSFDAVGVQTIWIPEGQSATLTIALRGEEAVIVALQ